VIPAVAAPAAAQRPSLSLETGSPGNGWRALVRPLNLFTDSVLVRPLLSGLPLRFHFQLELWHDKFLADGLVDRSSWSIILYQEPLSGEFNLTRSWDPQRDEWYSDLRSATQTLQSWYQSPFPGPTPGTGRFYYEARLEIEILSLGDLDELEDWLRGDVVGERSGVGSAFTRGFKRLFIRLIGLSARKIGVRSEPFRP
jgi:hypothetical protein